MGTTLTDKIVADTYDGLIKVTDNNVITGTKKRLTDGFGNDLPILVSTTDFQVDGTLILSGTTSQYVRGDGSLATLSAGITTLTTTGSSGASTLVGSTLNVPNYTLAGLGGVPTSRTLTINGTTFDLSANRSWTITDTGLTSVGISMPSAFSVSNSPLTSNGTISITGSGTTEQYIDGTGALQSFPISGQAGTIVRSVRNQTGATLTKGTVVYISGATGNKPLVSKALATGDSTSAQTFGVLQTDIANNAEGYAVAIGDLTGLNTSAYTEGTQLYLSSTTAGTYTSTKQYAPAHLVYIGIVTRSHVSLGQIEVKIQNGYELDELHDVIAQTPSNNDGIFYNSTSTKWENKSIATALGFTPVTNARTISTTSPLSGGGDLTANRTISIQVASPIQDGYLSSTDWNLFNSKGNVTSVGALTLGTSGTDLSSSVANGTTTPIITLNVPTASATNRGALSSADWTIFNNKQNALTNPITGTGTTNTLPKFTGTSALGNSNITDSGTLISLGSNTTISSGGLGIGSTALTDRSLSVAKQITGATTAYGIFSGGSIQTDVTASAIAYETFISQAVGGTLTNLTHFRARENTISGTLTNQTGFEASSVLTTGTNVYGFRGQIASASNRWNLYMNGTASNYLNGTTLIGSTTDNSTTAKLQVTGGISYQNIFNRQTASYTLVLTDQSKIVETNVGTANNLTIPLNSSVAFPIGTEIQVLQYGAGQTTIVATSGVTTRSKSGQLKIANQYTGVTLVKVGTDEWYVIGNLTA